MPVQVNRSSLAFDFGNSKFEEMAKKAIPSDFRMISSSHDEEVAIETRKKEYSKKSSFTSKLQENSSGGACTQAFLSTLRNIHENETRIDISWAKLLEKMRENILAKGSNQVPQLSSSRLIDVKEPFKIINDSKSSGIKSALVIGINYVGKKGELFGCHNDAKNMIDFLKTYQGFEDKNITILMDDEKHKSPTYRNIMRAFRELGRQSKSGDTVFIHYSGHGGRSKDTNGDEYDGYDETIIPVDFFTAGQIVDDEIRSNLVQNMKKGVLVTAMMDCCHSGSILDLPYRFSAGDDRGMGMEKGAVDFDNDDTPPECCCCIS